MYYNYAGKSKKQKYYNFEKIAFLRFVVLYNNNNLLLFMMTQRSGNLVAVKALLIA